MKVNFFIFSLTIVFTSYAMELPPAQGETVRLVSSEGVEFIVPRAAAQKAELIHALLASKGFRRR